MFLTLTFTIFYITLIKSNMKYLIKVLIVLLPLHSFSQSGYLGSKTNIQISITNPLTPFKYKGKRVDESNYKNTNLNLNASFALTVNRVLSDENQIGIGYRYTPMILFTNTAEIDIQSTTNPNIFQLTDVVITSSKRVDHHSFVFNYRKFSNGIAPIGKGWGVDLEYGRTSIQELEIDYVSGLSEVTNGLFNKKFTINNTLDNSITFIGNSIVNSFVIKGYVGRTIPISKKIGIDLSLSIPILRVLLYNDIKTLSYFISQKNELSNSTPQNTQEIAYSIGKYNGFSLNVGIKYFL